MGRKLKGKLNLQKHREKQVPKMDQLYLVYAADIEIRCWKLPQTQLYKVVIVTLLLQ